MARKPTRFWHPARRMLLRAEEKARSFVARHEDAATLDSVRPRLQHYLRAMYGEAVMIESLAPPKKAGWALRALRNLPLVKELGVSESNAGCIRLPAVLPGQRSSASPLEQYRVIAVQHAERMRRDSAVHARLVTTDLERDLYQLAEAAAIDAQIVANQPGLRAALNAARADSIAERSKPRFRSDIELRVEAMVRQAWPSGDDSTEPDGLVIPLDNDAESNATWARRTAVTLEATYGRKAAKSYRRVPEITLWQTTIRTQLPEEQQQALETETRQGQTGQSPDEWNSQSRSLIPGASKSQSATNKQGNSPGQSGNDEASSKSESKGGDSRTDNTNSGEANASDSGTEPNPDQDTLEPSDQQNTTDGSANSTGGRDGKSAVSHSGDTVDDAMLVEGITFRYPEWDFNTGSFNPAGTIVRVVPPPRESSEWATTALLEHARETGRAKRQFERLRSHRSRLRRQVQGDELDLEACVEAMVDRRMGAAPTDRLYSHVRPGRRDLAITLLIDVSGSTGEQVDGQQRVIDIERIAALVATAAFDALGDDYAILAFSSAGPSNVRVHTLKEFGETNSSAVLERISALAPRGTTRLGAAVRHATATLNKHPAPHRLLLILSDGKPHDFDWYFTDYAIQDSRQAIMQARLQGIHPFCITVDTSDEDTYLSEIFGSSGYRVVSRPSQLSQALLQAVQRMIGANG